MDDAIGHFHDAAQGAWLTHTPVGPNPAVPAFGDLLRHLP